MWAKIATTAKKAIDASKKAKQVKNALGEDGTEETKKKVVTGLSVGCFASFLGIVVLISLVAVFVLGPLFQINETLGKVEKNFHTFTESLGNFLTFRGWCTDSECQQKEKADFYEYVKELAEKPKYANLDVNLLVSTVTYSEPSGYISDDSDADFEDKLDNFEEYEKKHNEAKAKGEKLENDKYDPSVLEMSNKYDNVVDYRKSKKQVRKLAKKLVRAYDKYHKDLKNGTASNKTIDDYYYPVLEEFIRKNITKKDASDSEVNDVIKDIYSRLEFYAFIIDNNLGNRNYTRVYGYCSGVEVITNEGSPVGTFSLEEYVASVVQGENYPGQNMEAYKAFAIVARTFTLKKTENCTKPIRTSDSDQIFTNPTQDFAINAAKETEGLVLVNDGEIFMSMYDSYCYNDSDCKYGIDKENGKKYVIYKKQPGGETHKVYLSDKYFGMANGGHGEGMSVTKSYEMADSGKKYDEIIKYFYSDGVTISGMTTTIGGKFTSSIIAPNSVEDLKNRSMMYAAERTGNIGDITVDLTQIYKGNASNLGQCVWFAKSRALELIYNSDMPADVKIKAFRAIEATYANGEGWYRNPALDVFEKSRNYNEPRAGAIVSWSGGSSVCSPRCGHVAIIESVDTKNKTVVLADGYNSSGANGTASWGYVEYRLRTLTFEELRNYGSGYTFNGYVYILG